MLDFACPACGQRIKVKTELAGRKGKCPHCRQALTVPTPSGAAAPGWLADVRPALPPTAAEDATLPPRPEARPDTRSDADATGGMKAGPPSELTDFLSPPLGAGEIGRLGPYRVLKVLGAGGMGVVYQAEDPGLRRMVALKAMLPTLAASASARERFLREARSAAAVEHDHIVAVYQVGEDRGVPYLAMPFLKGEPLDERLKREKRLPVAEVLRITRETAVGLEAARHCGMIHRDIKPANLWLEEGTGRVKILDFGLARSAGDGAQLTQQGAILGTPAFMAPEQAGGKTDHRADLFSLGCVVYRMATGELPFKGADTISTLMAVATEPPRPPLELNPGLPPALADLILRLLAKKPEGRPASAQAVAEAVRAIEAAPKPRPSAAPTRGKAAPGGAVPKAAAKARPRRKSKAPMWLGLCAVAACLAAGLAAGGYVLLTHLRPSDPATTPGLSSGLTPDPASSSDPAGFGGKSPAPPKDAEWQPLFNNKDTSGWVVHKGRLDNWGVENGVLYTLGNDRGWLMTENSHYGDFELRLDYRISAKANTGVAIRAPLEGEPTFEGMEVQILDEKAYGLVKPEELNGALYGLAAPIKAARRVAKPPGEWNQMTITARGRMVTVDLNGVRITDADLDRLRNQAAVYPGVLRATGRIALQSHTSRAEFNDIRVRPLP